MTEHTASTRTYRNVAMTLFVLLAGTVIVAKLQLGTLAPVIALSIAAAKAVLVAMFFMHLYYGSRLTRVFAAAGLFWLLILLGLTLGDFLSRS